MEDTVISNRTDNTFLARTESQQMQHTSSWDQKSQLNSSPWNPTGGQIYTSQLYNWHVSRTNPQLLSRMGWSLRLFPPKRQYFFRLTRNLDIFSFHWRQPIQTEQPDRNSFASRRTLWSPAVNCAAPGAALLEKDVAQFFWRISPHVIATSLPTSRKCDTAIILHTHTPFDPAISTCNYWKGTQNRALEISTLLDGEQFVIPPSAQTHL